MKTKHGGKRPGAGRKPIGDKTMKRYQVMLSDEHAEKAKQLGNGQLSAGIRNAIESIEQLEQSRQSWIDQYRKDISKKLDLKISTGVKE